MTHIQPAVAVITARKIQIIDGPNAKTLADSLHCGVPGTITFTILLPHPFWKNRTRQSVVSVLIRGVNWGKGGKKKLIIFVQSIDSSAVEGVGVVHYDPITRRGTWQSLIDYCNTGQTKGLLVDMIV